MHRRHLLAPPLLAVIGALLAGCASGAAPTAAATDSAPGTGAPSDPDAASGVVSAPFTADNCGTDVTVASPPQRIITVKSAMTELVLALGAGDRLVGTAYQDGPVNQEDPLVSGEVALGTEQDVAALLADLPSLGERMPSREGVLALEPDLVLAGWESVFAADAAGERPGYADLGIATFVAPAACTQARYAPLPLEWSDVLAEVTQIGELLGTTPQAERVVTELQDHLDLAEQRRAELATDEAPSVLWWSSGSETPYVGAGQGAPQLILTTAGLTNIAADLPGGWGPYSWEAAAAADPDYLVLVDSEWNSAEHKKELLAQNPVTAAMTAVRDEHYLVVPFAATEAGVRNVEAVHLLLDQLGDN